jgi:hypothetical protein
VRFGATREDIRQRLESYNVETRPVWKPMHLQPAFRHCQVRGGAVAEHLFDHGLCLPSGSSMSDHEQAYVIAALDGMAGSPVADRLDRTHTRGADTRAVRAGAERFRTERTTRV